MLSRCEVLVIRILVPLQGKMLLETKKLHIEMFKGHYLTVQSLKNVEDTAFALFFRPYPGEFDSSRVPIPGNLPSKAKKVLMPRAQPAGHRWNWLMHTCNWLMHTCNWLMHTCNYKMYYMIVLCRSSSKGSVLLTHSHTTHVPHMYIHCVVIWNFMVYINYFF